MNENIVKKIPNLFDYFWMFSKNEILEELERTYQSTAEMGILFRKTYENGIANPQIFKEFIKNGHIPNSLGNFYLKRSINKLETNLLNKLVENLKEQYLNQKNILKDDQEILEIVNTLPFISKTIIEEAFGVNNNRKSLKMISEKLSLNSLEEKINAIGYIIVVKLGITKEESSVVKNREKIKEASIERDKSLKNKKIIQQRTKKFNKEIEKYSIKVVQEELKKSDLKNDKLLEYIYGLNGKPRKTYKEAAKTLNISEKSSVSSRLNMAEKSLLNRLYKKYNKENILTQMQEEFLKEFEEYPLEDVLEELKKLDTKGARIIEYKYGFNGKEVKTNREIMKILGINSLGNVIKSVKLQKATIYRKLHKKYNKSSYLNEKRVKLLKQFNSNLEEEIEMFLKNSLHKSSTVLEYLLGMNGKEMKSVEEIMKELNINQGQLRYHIEYGVKSFNGNKERNKQILSAEEEKKKKFYGKCSGYLESEIDNILASSNKKVTNVLEYRYGLNGKPCLTEKEIGKQLDIREDSVRKFAYEAQKLLKTKLEKRDKGLIFIKTKIEEKLENKKLNSKSDNNLDRQKKILFIARLELISKIEFNEIELKKLMKMDIEEIKEVLKKLIYNEECDTEILGRYIVSQNKVKQK